MCVCVCVCARLSVCGHEFVRVCVKERVCACERVCVPLHLCVCVCVFILLPCLQTFTHCQGLLRFPPWSVSVASLSGLSLELPCLLHSHPLYKSCGPQSPLLSCVTQYSSIRSLSLDQWFLIRAVPFGHLTTSAEMPGLF